MVEQITFVDGFSSLYKSIIDLFLMLYGGAHYIYEFFTQPNEWFEVPLVQVMFGVGIVLALGKVMLNFLSPPF